jgi:hypothetical protein
MGTDRLTSAECRTLGTLPKVVDCSRVRLYRRPGGSTGLLRSLVLWVSRDRAVALGNHVFLPDRCKEDLAVLAHELTHCGQYQAWGAARYFTSGLAAQLQDLLHRTMQIGSNPYRYEVEPGKPFGAYGMEQQGQIVEDCYRGHPDVWSLSPFHPLGERR